MKTTVLPPVPELQVPLFTSVETVPVVDFVIVKTRSELSLAVNALSV